MTATDLPTTLPGRLGDPALDLRTDPRAKPGLVAALAAFGLDGPAAEPPLTREAGPEAVGEAVAGLHDAFSALYASVPLALPGDAPDDAVEVTEDSVPSPDGHLVPLRLYRPAGVEGPLPAVVYIHGGGMTILDADTRVHDRWCRDLALTGVVAVRVAFRNAWTPLGLHPFPAGLDDCAATVRWLDDRRGELGLTRIVLQGESGGANLALATTLRAKRSGDLDAIDGVHVAVPYVSGGYAWERDRKRRELPSMIENDGYFINCALMDLLVASYDPHGRHTEDPLAWPYFATADDLAGLPPHVVTVNELDPLRDEGLAYYRKLLAAGVPASGRVNLGIVHGAEAIFRQALPDERRTALADIRSFVDALSVDHV
ncbi:alpha/beta hydrolase fold domain-containing protein [Actinomycetospora aeridis]|uniref:Alpha/beta hydrolase fold domain-containing protein n=1 Tax=Actinomycetospora aeridis TaxID=3129231 RepID=A0ABU8N641_9PSEU